MEEKRQLMVLLGKGYRISDACKEIGIARDTYYKWRKSAPDFAEQCDMIISSNRAARQEARRPAQEETHTTHGEKETPAAPEEDSDLRTYRGPRASAIAAEHAETLRRSLRELGAYTESLEPQIRAAAQLWGASQVMWEDIDRFCALQTVVSREGDPRLSVNPIFTAYKSQMESYTALLKSLGLNMSGKMEPKTESSRDSFFAALERDDD